MNGSIIYLVRHLLPVTCPAAPCCPQHPPHGVAVGGGDVAALWDVHRGPDGDVEARVEGPGGVGHAGVLQQARLAVQTWGWEVLRQEIMFIVSRRND